MIDLFGSTIFLLWRKGDGCRGFSPNPPGGGGFIFASLKHYYEKSKNLEIRFYRLKLNMLQTQNFRSEACDNPPGKGVLFWLAFPKIAKKNPHPPGGFGEKPL